MNPFRRPSFCLLLTCLLGAVGLPFAKGDEVTRQVQEELRRRNLYFGDVDGRFTSQIGAALRRYQQRKGFATSGQADETTLRSLSLLPPPAAVAETTAVKPAASAADGPGVYGPPVPWPDLPVLRSDLARQRPPLEDVREFVDPTPKPPPSAVSQVLVKDLGVRAFITEYLRTGQSNQPGMQNSFYGKQVDYFNEGQVNGAFIAKDTARYNKRWPDRHFTLVDPVTVSASSDGNEKHLSAEFYCRFVVRSVHSGKPADEDAGKTVRGETKNTYVLERIGPGPDDMKIVSIKEERVRGK